MKMNHVLAWMVAGGMVIAMVPSVSAMEAVDSPPQSSKQQKPASMTGTKKLTIAAIAALLAVSAAYLARLLHKYGKNYGWPAIVVAVRYHLPFQPLYLKIVAAAARHENALLKDELIALNTLLIGPAWRQTRPILINDFMMMGKRSFYEKHGAVIAKHITHLLKAYAAGSDLFFRKSHERTYMRGEPSVKNQVKSMDELDRAVGLN